MVFSLNNNGCFDFGFERMMTVYDTFVDELKKNSILNLYKDIKCLNIHIIHGSIDNVVPIKHSEEFCRITDANLYVVDNANHRFDQPGQVEKVVQIALKILLNQN